MRLRLHFLLAIALSGSLVACSDNRLDYDQLSEDALYARGQQAIDSENIKSTLDILEAMEKSFPFGPYAERVQFNLIYAYYKSDRLTLALSSVDRFLKLNPRHPNIDWVFYMRGLINMRQDDNMLQDLFNIDRADRDLDFAITAFKDFSYLVTRFPTSAYSADAEKRLIYLKNRLARHELKVAQYYTDRGAYVAVVNRVAKMMSTYPDTNATKQGLLLMRNAYEKLGISKEVAVIDKLIKANPSKS